MKKKLFKLNEKGSFILEDGEPLKPLGNVVKKLNEQQAIIDKQELRLQQLEERLQQLEELLELSENLNKSYREKLIDMNLKMMRIDDEC